MAANTRTGTDTTESLDEAAARHLLRRSGFEPRAEEVAELVGKSRAEAAASVLSPGDSSEYARLLAGQRILRETASLPQIQAWWLARMVRARRPLAEKLALFWHGHFATSDAKVRSPRLMLDQNLRLLEHGRGRFSGLLQRMSVDPAMLVWLDSAENVRGKPNENFARELMELFSLGIGNYSEADIREAARALTGWSVRGEKAHFAPGMFDRGEKVIFGQRGEYELPDVVELCVKQPACPRFLASKLLRFYLEPNPSQPAIERWAQRLVALDLALGPFLAELFGSEEFYAARVRRVLVKSPLEYVVGTFRQLELRGSLNEAVSQAAAMGQALFHPPSVKGWDGQLAWLSAASLLARTKFARWAADSARGGSRAVQDLPGLAARLGLETPGGAAGEALAAALQSGERAACLAALLGSPEYQMA